MSATFVEYPFHTKTYSARSPQTGDGMTERRKVVIAGGGPVGLTVALALAAQGIASVIIEADDSVCSGSRAICISRRSLQILQRAGVADRFLATGLSWTDGRSYYRDREVLHFSMPNAAHEKFPPMLNIQQYHIEQLLLDQAEALPDLVDIRWATRVRAIASDAQGCRVTVKNARGAYDIDADWLIACDGGQSTVRDLMGLTLSGESYEGRYVIADVLMDVDLPTERLAWFDPPSNPGSSVLMHKQPDSIWRIDYQIEHGENPQEAVKPENVLPRIQSHLDFMGITVDWHPIWITIYKAHALSLEKYRHGRVLFAGDAAHLVPIFGVRGANSGIDDADNLAWKLALVLSGAASEDLLDSYSEERVFATMQNLSYGRKSTEFMAPPSFAFAQMRTAVLTLAERHPEVRPLINPRQSSTIHYTESPLNAPTSEESAFDGGPAVGAIIADADIVDGNGTKRHLSDLLNYAFTLVHFGEGPGAALARQTADRLKAKGLRAQAIIVANGKPKRPGAVRDDEGTLWRTWAAEAGTVYLLRPDDHVLGRWRSLQPDVVIQAVDRLLNPAG